MEAKNESYGAWIPLSEPLHLVTTNGLPKVGDIVKVTYQNERITSALAERTANFGSDDIGAHVVPDNEPSEAYSAVW